MKFRLISKFSIWIMLLSFSGQIVFADVIRNDSQPQTKTNQIQADIVRNDGQPKVNTPNVNPDIVRNDGQPAVKTPAVSGDIVRNDGQPAVKTPAVSGDIVRNDGQPAVKTPAVSGDIVRNDGQPSVPTNLPTVRPFVGEAVVGVSLLIAYGPQIIALATTVATIAALVSVVTNTSKDSVSLVKSIGLKFKRMLELLLGPLTVSSGMAKDGVNGVSDHLLKVAKFVSNSINTPVSDVQAQVDKSIAMTKDVQNLASRGKNISGQMKELSGNTKTDLAQIIQGGEVQIFRDGAKQVADKIGNQAKQLEGVFNQTTENSKMSEAALESLKSRIDQAVTASNKSANDVTLQDIGVSGVEVSKQLIEARKYMVMSNSVLGSADKSVAGLHSELLTLLGDIKTDLESLASQKGISKSDLEKMLKDPAMKAKIAATSTSSSAANASPEKNSEKLADEISFMADDLAKLNSSTYQGLLKSEAQKSADRVDMENGAGNAQSEQAYKDMVQSYKKYITTVTKNPGNKPALEIARDEFEEKQTEFNQTSEK